MLNIVKYVVIISILREIKTPPRVLQKLSSDCKKFKLIAKGFKRPQKILNHYKRLKETTKDF